MEFGKIAGNLPTAEEIVRALGLQASQRNTSSDIVPSVALFGAGLLVGAGLALLLAPSSGRDLREGIVERAGELSDDLTDRVGALRDSVAADDADLETSE